MGLLLQLFFHYFSENFRGNVLRGKVVYGGASSNRKLASFSTMVHLESQRGVMSRWHFFCFLSTLLIMLENATVENWQS